MSPRERLFALEVFGIKLGLHNIRTLLDAWGVPERSAPVVHIAGTNGKGSVAAMVERGLRAAGHRTGRYTSPHLADIEERIAVNGTPVDPREFDALAGDFFDLVDSLRQDGRLEALPTFFEATTAIAFEAFRRAGVTAAVIEVGLGGRYDATNVVSPVVAAITSIALDHEAHLGSTVSAIAFQKAGIIKPGVPVVAGEMPDDARRVIEDEARRACAPLVHARAGRHGMPVTLALHGDHQRANAAVAVEVLRQCREAGLGVAEGHVVTALTDVSWPARLEWLRVPGLGDVLMDAAHNPAGAEALARYLTSEVGPRPLVFGVMQDKDVDGMVQALAPAASLFVATQATTARALDAPALARHIQSLAPGAEVACEPDPAEALARAAAHGVPLAVAGSILLVGPLRASLLAQGAVPVRYPSRAGPFYLP